MCSWGLLSVWQPKYFRIGSRYRAHDIVVRWWGVEESVGMSVWMPLKLFIRVSLQCKTTAELQLFSHAWRNRIFLKSSVIRQFWPFVFFKEIKTLGHNKYLEFWIVPGGEAEVTCFVHFGEGWERSHWRFLGGSGTELLLSSSRWPQSNMSKGNEAASGGVQSGH